MTEMLPSYISLYGFIHMPGVQDNNHDTCEILDSKVIMQKVFPPSFSTVIMYQFNKIMLPTVKYIYHPPSIL